MKKWSIEQAPVQTGNVALVTGANSGIGYATSLGLAQKGARLIMACRNESKAKEAKFNILRKVPDAEIEILKVDLSRLSEIDSFAEQVYSRYNAIDLLINNAGIMMPPYEITEDGFESQFATNYLSHFTLTGLLLPLLEESRNARIVTLTSLSYKWSKIQFEDLHFQGGYKKSKAYGQSKRACLIFSYELQRRLAKAGHNIQSMAAHPGLSDTNLDRYFPNLIKPLGPLILQSPSMGALPVLFAAIDDNAKGGDFIGPDGMFEIRGFPTKVESDSYSKSEIIGERLWSVSERLTGVYY